MKTTLANHRLYSSLDRTTQAVLALGVFGALLTLVWVGWVQAFSVFLGSLMGATNLWVLSRLVPRLMASDGPKGIWAILSALKVAMLFALVALLVSTSLVNLLFLCLGYLSVPLGIVVGQLFPTHQANEER